MSKALEFLKKGRELIAKPENWTKLSAARDKRDRAVSATHCNACKFCSIGALRRVEDDNAAYVEARHMLDTAAYKIADVDIIDYNDQKTHAEVLAVWDAAIQEAS